VSEFVLDASAILAYLNDEPGADKVAAILEHGGAVINAANYAEVAARLIVLGLPQAKTAEVMRSLELEVVPLDAETAWISACLIATTKPFGLSLGDRCCLALGKRMVLPVLTADRVWANIQSDDLDVRLIRS